MIYLTFCSVLPPVLVPRYNEYPTPPGPQDSIQLHSSFPDGGPNFNTDSSKELKCKIQAFWGDASFILAKAAIIRAKNALQISFITIMQRRSLLGAFSFFTLKSWGKYRRGWLYIYNSGVF